MSKAQYCNTQYWACVFVLRLSRCQSGLALRTLHQSMVNFWCLGSPSGCDTFIYQRSFEEQRITLRYTTW
jgi:hypothetical protein